jgi:hypothetical protein
MMAFIRLVLMRVSVCYRTRIRVGERTHVTDEGENRHSDQQPCENSAVQDG